ncbi:hypothetical protein EVAR_35290_1 [Eumeta japonica]|uniref:Secreted protein n=1 Tax=Eumeta variegata TaxID=151549 RepID=A0A4C1XJV9_EUMVA|nr:hypothetical protein EVAR_35290_1 [Eumeta japonica]
MRCFIVFSFVEALLLNLVHLKDHPTYTAAAAGSSPRPHRYFSYEYIIICTKLKGPQPQDCGAVPDATRKLQRAPRPMKF